jgi:5-hydroxyisourate hydrolase-like protein (transthyretin family)
MRLKEEDPCWDDYEMVGMKKKNGKEVPNCVPKSEATDSEEQEFHTKLDKLVHNTFGKSPDEKKMDENFAVQMMVAKAIADQKVKNPETKKDVRVTTALKDKEHPAHGKAKSLVQRLKDKFSKKESVDEAASFKITNTISKKEWAKTHKDYKSVIDGVPYVMKLTDKGTALVPVKIVESVNEGKKRFNTNYGVGKSKYVVNYHDGVKKHKDGSDFFDVQIFKNQNDLEAFKKALLQKGFVAESVTEAASRTAMEIGGLTGLNKDAVQKFVDDNNLDIEKVYQYVKVGKLPERMALVSAIAGKPGNSVQVKLIKKFK